MNKINVVKHCKLNKSRYTQNKDSPTRNYHSSVNYIGKLPIIDKIEKVFGEIKNRDIVITNERLNHIREKHKDDFEFIMNHIREAIEDYNYILKDSLDSVHFIKMYNDDEKYTNLLVILSLKDENKANSIVTGMRIGDATLKRLLKKQKIIDKK